MKRIFCAALCTVLLAGFTGCAKEIKTSNLYISSLPAEIPDDNSRAYYEIFVGSFFDSDGDGIGDLAGILEKLDYLNDGALASQNSLHISGLWLMPVMPSPTYHKYDVTDYCAIAPEYGTLADFEALITACAARNIDVIIDLVLNHTSNEHPWFLSACESISIGSCGEAACIYETPCRAHNPYCEYYNFSTAKKSGYHAVHAVDAGDAQANSAGAGKWYYEGQFWSGMPDLNLSSPLVRAEIGSIVAFWLDRGVAGFRLDAVTSYYTGNTSENVAFLQWLNKTVKSLKPDAYLVGEAWSDAGTVAQYYQSGVDSFFNFPFSQASGSIIKSVRAEDGAGLAANIESWQGRIAAANAGAIDALFLSNHDNVRSAGALLRDPVLQKQAAAVYLLMPGNPFIYYGEEIGMTGGSENDPNKRAPLTWSLTDATGIAQPPEGTTVVEPVSAGIQEQLADADSLLRFYIGALAVRNTYPTLARGSARAVDTGNAALCAYQVTWQGQTLLVVHNLGTKAAQFEAADATLVAAMSAGEAGLPAFKSGILTLPMYSTAVLEPAES